MTDFNSTLFAELFNSEIRPAFKKHFPFPLVKENFEKLMENWEKLAGQKSVELNKFIAVFSVIYNETGGRFEGLSEIGSVRYMYEPNNRSKVSYNKPPNRLASEQLKDDRYSGFYLPKDYKKDIDRLKNCDFFKFRGRGLNQLTWRNNYEAFVNPILKKENLTIDDLTDKQLEERFEDIGFCCEVFYNFTHSQPHVIKKLEQGDFKPFGNQVSGFWRYYVENKYLPRCNALLSFLSDKEPDVSIQNLSLSSSEIRMAQTLINDFGKNDIEVDGVWGKKSQKAFIDLDVGFGDLILFGLGHDYFEPEQLSRDLVREVQKTLLDTEFSNIISNSGGIDGILGVGTKTAIEMYLDVYF